MATPHTFSLALPSDVKSYEVKFQVNQIPSEFNEKTPFHTTQKLISAPITPESEPDVVAADAVKSEAPKCPFISLPSDFQIRPVDDKIGAHLGLALAVEQPPPLGPLVNFAGTFAGKGLNLIFRPHDGQTPFPKPPTIPPGAPDDNVLEINLTEETLTFSKSLGKVPNRGLEKQKDIFLNGIPYVQSINDVANDKTGKADGPAIAIHFEPGLWMHIPATTEDPVNDESLVRMASIPHGTTINAQLTNQGILNVNGPPQFQPVDITPFPIGGDQKTQGIKFLSQTANNDATPRIPQDLTKYIAAGTITQDILNDPNRVLLNAIAGQKIVKTTVFTVSTTPSSPEQGGGTANISFLVGAPPPPAGTTSKNQTGPNANAVFMSSIFWIETVEHTIVVPPWKPGKAPLRLSPTRAHPDQHVPVFEINPPHEITAPKTIVVQSPQIQYSQTVFLNFAGLTWPHVSVATLVPSAPQPVPHTAWN